MAGEGGGGVRPETGQMQFGDDWPGVFIRGDNAAHYMLTLRQALSAPDLHPLTRMTLEGLCGLLAGSNVHSAEYKRANVQHVTGATIAPLTD